VRDPWLLLLFGWLSLVLSGTLGLFATARLGRLLGPAWRADPAAWLPAFALIGAPLLALGLLAALAISRKDPAP
jgi:hypothetical protein